MNIKLALPLLALTGCMNSKPPTFVVREVPVAVSSTNSLHRLRYPSTYRAISVGRRPDPANPDILHDSYVLYIRDQPERWNLRPSEHQLDLPGAPRPAAEVPLPLDEQLRLELRKQKAATQAVEEQSQRLQMVTESIPPLVRSTATIATNLAGWQQRFEERLRLLEAERFASNASTSLILTNH
ncbi:MAG: hypothetical protein JNN07_22865 [Verrucomicrobiales bacterium]|nr:hypothetical protein [Verrucomicrobiales bacterium]